jgi:hypothetical protein
MKKNIIKKLKRMKKNIIKKLKRMKKKKKNIIKK